MLNRLRARLAAALGRRGEDAAKAMLRQAGWRILDRNWRQVRLELDLVCDDGTDLVFVEVRTRKEQGMVSPAESVTSDKQRSLIKAARAYMVAHNSWERSCRFDVICIVADDTLHLEHIRHAFEYAPSMGRGYAAR